MLVLFSLDELFREAVIPAMGFNPTFADKLVELD